MSKYKRVHELAKELGMSASEILNLCSKLGIHAPNPSSKIIDAQADRVRNRAERDGVEQRTQPKNPELTVGKIIEAHADRLRNRAKRDGVDQKTQPKNPELTVGKIIEAHADRLRNRAKRDGVDQKTQPKSPEPAVHMVVASGVDPRSQVIRLVVFDLDGTLANTDSLPSGIRLPYHLLEPHGWVNPHDWSFGEDVLKTPDILQRAGYKVAIATRAPIAYASTLVHLLGLSTQMIRASCGAGTAKATVLLEIAEKFGFEPAEMLYVGDLELDREIATLACCKFAHAEELHSGDLLRSLPPLLPKTTQKLLDDYENEIRGNYFNPDPQISGLIRLISRSIRNGIPDPITHTNLLHKLAECEGLKKIVMAGLSLFSLQVRPGTTHRTYWQKCLFRNLEPGSAACLINDTDGMFQVDPRVITRGEINSRSEQYAHYAHFVGHAIATEPIQISNGQTSLALHAAFKFSMSPSDYGSYMSRAKNYTKARGSGPNVQLGLIDFMADLMVSQIYDFSLPRDIPWPVLIPIPSSPFSANRVGEMSYRLAQEVSKRSGLELWPIVYKDAGNSRWEVRGPDGYLDFEVEQWPIEAILIEDQSTTGESLIKAALAVARVGITVEHAMAYSTSLSSPNGLIAKHISPLCYFADLAKTLSLRCNCARSTQIWTIDPDLF